MMNGNITKFRIVASGIIGFLTVGGGIFLLYRQVEIPIQFWYLGVASLVGVVGADVLASVVKKYKE